MADIPGINGDRGKTIQAISNVSPSLRVPVNLQADPTTGALLVSGTFSPPALQNVNLTQVGSAAFTLGQALAASSLPVVLTAAQITTLTPPFAPAAALSDSYANPTTAPVGSFLMGWNTSTWERLRVNIGDGSTSAGLQNIAPMMFNGTTYDRTRGDIANGLDVDVTRLPTLANVTTVATVTNVATIGTSVTPGVAATNLGKAEDAGHTTGDTGIFSLGVRNDTLADTSTTNNDYTQFSTDIKGRLMVGSTPRALKTAQITTITTSTSETTVLTAVASTFLDVYGVIVVNSSATASNISFRDATAGTVRFNIYVPAGETRGFMLPTDAAYPQATVNNNWTATSSASVTSIIITLLAVKNI